MKKMIFSAVALVAFSFAGMANEIEEKRVEKESIVKEKGVKIIVTIEDPCVQFSFDALDSYEALTGTQLSPLAAGRFMLKAYDLCDSTRD